MSPSPRHTGFPRALVLAALLAAPATAWAADAPRSAPAKDDATSPKPAQAERVEVEIPKVTRTYEEKTSPADRERARKLFTEGNKAFEQRQVDRSLQLYEQAYAIWPHPRVLFNKAVSLGFLGRPLESAVTFKEVLEYGPDPISELRYKQAVERYLELMGQLATLVVNCSEVGAKIYVNGVPIGEAPLSKKVTLGPGTHMITASLVTKVPYTAQVRLGPGELKRVTVALEAFSDVVQYKMVNRYSYWIPTAVTVAAVALAAAGAGLVVKGQNDIETLISEVNTWTPKTDTHAFDSGARDSGVGLQKAGYALVGVGGTAAATAVLLWILQKKRVKFTAEATKGGVEISF